MENEFPATGGGVDVFRQALKANVSVVQISNPLNEVFERSAQPVKPPDNEGITLPYIQTVRFYAAIFSGLTSFAFIFCCLLEKRCHASKL